MGGLCRLFRRYVGVFVVMGALVCGSPATARIADASEDLLKTVEASDKSVTVVITGKKRLNRIDRQVYDNSRDPGRQGASAADALRRVPGVSIDPSGNVTLRGRGVQIFVNGRPSPMLDGQARASVLRAMPSAMIDSVEVMTNPGAQYGSEGAGGIINIVTNAAMPPGGTLMFTGQATSFGGVSTNGAGFYNVGKFRIMAFANAEKTANEDRSGSSLSQRGSAGLPVRTTDNNIRSRNDGNMSFVNFHLDYAGTEKDTVSADLNYAGTKVNGRNNGVTADYDAAGMISELAATTDRSHSVNESQTAALTWSRKGRQTGEGLKVDARLSRVLTSMTSDMLTTYRFSSLPENTGQRTLSNRYASNQLTGIFSIDYNTSLGDDLVTSGLQFTRDSFDSNSLTLTPYTPGVETPSANPELSNRFAYHQTLSAAYVTYQKPVGEHWIFQGGLRSETLDFRTRPLDGIASVDVTYNTLSPSAFMTYVLSESRRFRLNYSRRLRRPSPQELNPSVVYVNAQSVYAGSSRLKPQQTDSYEASYEFEHDGQSYSVRGYYLRDSQVINSVSIFIPDPQNVGNQVLKIERQNNGSNRQAGVEAVVNRQLTKTLSIDFSANIYTVQTRRSDMPRLSTLTTSSGRIGLGYTTRNKGYFYLSINMQGRQLTGDGYMSGNIVSNFEYNRPLTDKVTVRVAVNDVFRSQKVLYVRDTPVAYARAVSTSAAPVISLSLTRAFGFGGF